jgi:hypothetical protein
MNMRLKIVLFAIVISSSVFAELTKSQSQALNLYSEQYPNAKIYLAQTLDGTDIVLISLTTLDRNHLKKDERFNKTFLITIEGLYKASEEGPVKVNEVPHSGYVHPAVQTATRLINGAAVAVGSFSLLRNASAFAEGLWYGEYEDEPDEFESNMRCAFCLFTASLCISYGAATSKDKSARFAYGHIIGQQATSILIFAESPFGATIIKKLKKETSFLAWNSSPDPIEMGSNDHEKKNQ